jgi:hypothetical protein
VSQVALRFGPLAVEGYKLLRSGIRWLCEDGHLCRQGDPIAYCHVGLHPGNAPRNSAHPFDREARDLKMLIAAPLSGRLHQRPDLNLGGLQDVLLNRFWISDEIMGSIEPEPAQSTGNADCMVRLFMVANRNVTALAGDGSGLLTGWISSNRICHADGDGPMGTLLSLGICELMGVIKGKSLTFFELLDAIKGPAHIVYASDYALTPSARILSEQIRRTAEELEAIAQDLAGSLAGGAIVPDAADWMFAGAVLDALGPSPATERHTVLTREGLRSVPPPDAIVLSLHAEGTPILRHRRLGYSFTYYNWRMADAGRAFEPWLRANFEPVRRTVQDIRADYRVLIDLIRAKAPRTQILICNMMSTSGVDDVQSYAGFDAPIGETVASVHSKEMNLMLCDLARDCDVAIVDSDAIAAEFGGRTHIFDGVHQSGEMQAEMRAEILHILRDRGVPGFEASEKIVPTYRRSRGGLATTAQT